MVPLIGGPRVVRFIETESVVVPGAEEQRAGSRCLMGTEFESGEMKTFGDGGTRCGCTDCR